MRHVLANLLVTMSTPCLDELGSYMLQDMADKLLLEAGGGGATYGGKEETEERNVTKGQRKRAAGTSTSKRGGKTMGKGRGGKKSRAAEPPKSKFRKELEKHLDEAGENVKIFEEDEIVSEATMKQVLELQAATLSVLSQQRQQSPQEKKPLTCYHCEGPHLKKNCPKLKNTPQQSGKEYGPAQSGAQLSLDRKQQ